MASGSLAKNPMKMDEQRKNVVVIEEQWEFCVYTLSAIKLWKVPGSVIERHAWPPLVHKAADGEFVLRAELETKKCQTHR